MGKVYLTDFGLAKSIATGSTYTRTGQALGTPAYMAPEQARGETALTPAADVWALGCVLHELLAGRRPFDGDTPAEVIAAVLVRDPVRLRAVRPDLPPALDIVLRACLSKGAPRRLASAHALARDLDRVLRGERPLARPPARGAPLAVAAVVLAAGAVVAAIVARPAARPPTTAAPAPEIVEAERWVREADALGWRDVAAAAGLYDRASARCPERGAWRVQAGIMRWMLGDLEAARARWEAVPDGAPETARARWLTGLVHFLADLDAVRKPPYVEAARAWDVAARAPGPDGRLARAGLALLALDFEAARTAAAAEAGWEARLLAGFVETSAGILDAPWDPAAAERAFDAVIADGVPLAGAYANRGALRIWSGNREGAAEDFASALRIRPDDRRTLQNRADLYLQTGQPALALADAEAAMRVDSANSRVLNILGQSRLAMGDVPGAREALDAACAADPTFPVARVNRGELRKAAGDVAGALEDYEAALAARPSFAGAWSGRGLIRAEAGRYAEALADLDRAIALAPRNPGMFAIRGDVRFVSGDATGAVADLERARDLAPPGWDALSTVEQALAEARAAAAARRG